MTSRRGHRRGSRLAGLLVVSVAVLGTALVGPSFAQNAPEGGSFGPPAQSPPDSTPDTQRDEVKPAARPATTCRVYASPSGFGMLCSSAGVGQTLTVQAGKAGIDTSKPFCWDDPDLPDGFDPQGQGAQPAGEGRWFLHTCLSFDGKVVRDNARVTYEYRFLRPGTEDRLTFEEEQFVTRVLGRGQIPFLQVQTSPISSPRVGQDVAFSMLCSPKVTCRDTAEGRRIETPRLDVGGVVMHAELVHLRVLPLGASRPDVAVDCRYAGLPQTAEQLDAGDPDDPRVCRYAYERSSDGQRGPTRDDRYPATVTAYWQVFVDDGTGPVPFRFAYEKSSTSLVRVTEVQTLVVS